MKKNFCWYVSLKTIRQPKIAELLDLNFGKKTHLRTGEMTSDQPFCG